MSHIKAKINKCNINILEKVQQKHQISSSPTAKKGQRLTARIVYQTIITAKIPSYHTKAYFDVYEAKRAKLLVTRETTY